MSLSNVLLIGVGEYTTGYVNGQPSNSDKAAGIIALTFFDLRARGLIGPNIGLCGVQGSKLPAIRSHMQRCIADRYHLDTTCTTYPADNTTDAAAYLTALADFTAGDIAVITTPDQTHFTIAMACIERGLHVLLAKPIVKTLSEHHQLIAAARTKRVLVAGEYHKRWDPLYSDAVSRIRSNAIGAFSYYTSYMSQPKQQLVTFGAWAHQKQNSDISYYLNAHHVDFLSVALQGHARPVRVLAMASAGMANQYLQQHSSTTNTAANGSAAAPAATESAQQQQYDVEDTITLTVQYESLASSSSSSPRSSGVAVFTSSWTAPKSDAHTQQRFFYLGHSGEISIDQAHRGYTSSTDNAGFASHNPLFFRYPASRDGKFAGQSCYGYLSFEYFVDAVQQVKRDASGGGVSEAVREAVACIESDSTQMVTAILEAGRRSLDTHKMIELVYDDKQQITGFKHL